MTHQQAVERHAVERYLLDEMPELERFAFEEHYFGCAICADDLRVGAVMEEGVKAGLLPAATPAVTSPKAEGASEPRPLPDARQPQTLPEPRASGWRTAMPWAVAAMLALATGYQALWVVPGLRARVVEPSVLAPVTLRGASRGAPPSLTRPTTGVIALAVDLGSIAAGTRLTYDLRAADGSSAATGTAAAPPPGTPLLLLIPASALHADGTYVLSVGTGAADSASVDYRFEVRSEK
jgi:hypothetical protein